MPPSPCDRQGQVTAPPTSTACPELPQGRGGKPGCSPGLWLPHHAFRGQGHESRRGPQQEQPLPGSLCQPRGRLPGPGDWSPRRRRQREEEELSPAARGARWALGDLPLGAPGKRLGLTEGGWGGRQPCSTARRAQGSPLVCLCQHSSRPFCAERGGGWESNGEGMPLWEASCQCPNTPAMCSSPEAASPGHRCQCGRRGSGSHTGRGGEEAEEDPGGTRLTSDLLVCPCCA